MTMARLDQWVARPPGRVRRFSPRTVVWLAIGAGVLTLGLALAIPPTIPAVRERPDATLSSWLAGPGTRRPLIVAHEGAPSLRIPSNSLASFQRAAALGAEVMELDVRFSADGVPIVIHDEKIPFFQAPGCAGTIVSRTAAADLTRCSLFPSLSQKILPLDELVRWARGRTILEIDLKELDAIGPLADRLHRLDALSFCYISLTAWHAAQHRAVLDRRPDLRLSLRLRTVRQLEAVVAGDRPAQVFMVEIDGSLDRPVTPDELEGWIARIHSAGLKVMASGDKVLASTRSHLQLLSQGYDAVLSYDVPNGVEAARRFREAPTP
ncbi:MAG TPA: glycerophosphodiester phosphodiesterase family protein [Thermoanaerobaculaceae bacterium]|nr:glycerophosphodiester phosphodiesterase family protein [Thermoanaerobaculaceae bacterium]